MGDIVTTISVDVTGTGELSALAAAADKAGAAVDKLEAQAGKGLNFGAASGGADKLAASYEAAFAKIQAGMDKLNASMAGIGKAGAGADAGAAGLAKIAAAEQAAGEQAAAMAAEVGKADDALKGAGGTADVAAAATGRYADAAKAAAETSAGLGDASKAGAAGLDAQAASAAASRDALGKNAAASDAAAASASRGGKAAAASAGSGGWGVLKTAVLGFAVAGAYGIDKAMGLNAEVTRLYTAAGLTHAPFKQVEQDMLRIGTQTGFTGTQIAQAMYHPVSAGLNLATSLGLVTQAANLANIHGASLEDTTYGLSSVMKAYNQSAKDVVPTAALLNSIVGQGDTRFQDFNQSVKNWAPAGASMGISIQSMGAGLAYLTDRGNSAEVASTRLTMGLSMATAGSKAANTYMRDLGLTTGTLDLKNKSLQKTMEAGGLTTNKFAADLKKPDGLYVALSDMQHAFTKAGLSAGQADQVMAKIFGGGRSDKAIVSLMQNLDGLKQKYDQIGAKSSPSVFAASAAQEQATPEQKWKDLTAGLKNAATGFGLELLPAFTKAAGFADHILADLNGSKGAWKDVAIGAGGLAALFTGKKLVSGIEGAFQTGETALRGIGKLFNIPGLSTLGKTSGAAGAAGMDAAAKAQGGAASGLSGAAEALSGAAASLEGAAASLRGGALPGSKPGEPGVAEPVPGEKAKPGEPGVVPVPGEKPRPGEPGVVAVPGEKAKPAGEVPKEKVPPEKAPSTGGRFRTGAAGILGSFLFVDPILAGISTGPGGKNAFDNPFGMPGPNDPASKNNWLTSWSPYERAGAAAGHIGSNFLGLGSGPGVFKTIAQAAHGELPPARATGWASVTGGSAGYEPPGGGVPASQSAAPKLPQGWFLGQTPKLPSSEPALLGGAGHPGTVTIKPKIEPPDLSAFTAKLGQAMGKPVKLPPPDVSSLKSAESAISGFEAAMAQAMGHPVKVPSPDLSALKSAAGAASGAGASVGSGFASGISSEAGAVTAAAAGLAADAASAMSTRLVSHSPSQVTKKIGKDEFGAGLAEGIKAAKGTVGAAAASIGSASVKSLLEGLEGGQSNKQNVLTALTGALANPDAVNTVQQTIQTLLADIPAGKDAGLVKWLNAQQSKLTKLANQQGALMAQISNAQQIATSQIGSASITGAGAYVPALAASYGPLAAQSTLTGMGQMAADQKQYASVLAGLKKAGLNATSLSQFAQEGASAGLPQALGLLQGGKGSVSQANASEAQIIKASQGIGSIGGTAQYGAQQAAMSGLDAALKKQLTTLDTVMSKEAQAVIAHVEKALGTKGGKSTGAASGSTSAAGTSGAAGAGSLGPAGTAAAGGLGKVGPAGSAAAAGLSAVASATGAAASGLGKIASAIAPLLAPPPGHAQPLGGGGSGGHAQQPVHVHVHLDSQVIATSVQNVQIANAAQNWQSSPVPMPAGRR